MPEWAVQFIAATLVAALGWLIVNKLNRIDRKLDRYEERQVKVERDCLTWEEFREEMGPLKATVQEQGKDLAEVKAHCQERHKAA